MSINLSCDFYPGNHVLRDQNLALQVNRPKIFSHQLGMLPIFLLLGEGLRLVEFNAQVALGMPPQLQLREVALIVK